VHSLNGEYTSVLNGNGGIVLLHDTKKQTAAMLPSFLRLLKKGGYRIVHVVPANP
jgi:peptidoglycan-N-acetylglucosamine deacetylase